MANSSTLTGPGLDLEDFASAVGSVERQAEEFNLGGPVEIHLASDGYGEGTVYLEVADVLHSVMTGRVVVVAGKRVVR
jgi:hypothetical protein